MAVGQLVFAAIIGVNLVLIYFNLYHYDGPLSTHIGEFVKWYDRTDTKVSDLTVHAGSIADTSGLLSKLNMRTSGFLAPKVSKTKKTVDKAADKAAGAGAGADDDDIVISDMITVNGETRSSGNSRIPSTFAPCVCTDPEWCDLPMPAGRVKGSPTPTHFNMPAITNQRRWEHAKCLAARGDQVLLRRILHYFPSDANFLNGDGDYAHLQPEVDIFLNPIDSFKSLIAPDNVDKHVSLPGAMGSVEPDVKPILTEAIPAKESLYVRMARANSGSSSSNSGSLPGVGGIRPGAPSSSIHYPIVSLGYPLLARGKADASGERPYFGGSASRKVGGYYLCKSARCCVW